MPAISMSSFGSGGGGATTLSALLDVSISSLANGDLLQYQSGPARWVNVHPSTLSFAAGQVTTGTFDASRIPTLDAAKIGTGVFDIARIPAASLERVTVVADQSARYSLTNLQVQNGDVIYQNDTTTHYFVVDDTNLGNSSGYQVMAAGTAASVPWSGVSSKPAELTQAASTSLSGWLTSTDWNTFAGKEPGGTAASTMSTHLLAFAHSDIAHSNRSALDGVSGSNTGDETQNTIKTKLGAASGSADGYLTSTDWSAFSAKMSSLSVTDTDTIDLTYSGGSLSADFKHVLKADLKTGGNSIDAETNSLRIKSRYLVLGDGNNYVGGNYSGLLGGEYGNAAAYGSVVLGGQYAYADGQKSVVLAGIYNYTGGQFAVALGGARNRAIGEGSVAMGRQAYAANARDFVIGNGVSEAANPTDETYNAFRVAQNADVHIGRYIDQSAVTGASNTLFLHTTNASNQSKYIALKAPSNITGSTTYTLPGDGTSGYALITNGSGTLSWGNFETAGAASAAISSHLSAFAHADIAHSNRTALDNVSGTNTGDETNATIKSKLGAANGSNDGYLASSDFSAFAGKQDAGLAVLMAGRAGGQTVAGGTLASQSLTLTSTGHSTKGSILFGTSAYDEVNNRLGIGVAAPVSALHVAGAALIGGDTTSSSAALVLDSSTFWSIPANVVPSSGGIIGRHALQPAFDVATGTTTSGYAHAFICNSFTNIRSAATRTITNAAVVYIGAAPTAGTGVAITNGYSLRVAGSSLFDSNLSVTGSLGADGSTFKVDSVNHRVGIGNSSPNSELEVSASGAPVIRLSNGASTTSYTSLKDFSSVVFQIQKVGAAGATTIDIDPIPADGTSGGNYRIFRTTNTTADCQIQIFLGDATATVTSVISAKGSSYFGNVTDSRMSIGTATGLSKLYVAGGLSQAGWIAAGAGINFVTAAATFTDTTSSGTIAGTYINRFSAPTIAASNSTTLTQVANLRVDAPVAGSNVTFTNPAYAAWFGSSIRIDGFVGLGTVPAALFHISGAPSVPAWSINGIGLRFAAYTATDTTSSGTVAKCINHRIAAATFAASNTTTYTEAINFYVAGAINAGSNVTITNSYALYVEAGASLFKGAVAGTSTLTWDTNTLHVDSTNHRLGVGTTSPSEVLHVVGRVIEAGTYAGIHVHDATATQAIANGTGYTKVTAFVDNGLAANCTADATNDKITVTKAGIYQVHFNCSFASGTANVTWKLAAFLGGVEQDQCHCVSKLGAIGDVTTVSFCGLIDVTSANTDLDVQARHDNGSSVNIAVKYASLNVTYVGET